MPRINDPYDDQSNKPARGRPRRPPVLGVVRRSHAFWFLAAAAVLVLLLVLSALPDHEGAQRAAATPTGNAAAGHDPRHLGAITPGPQNIPPITPAVQLPVANVTIPAAAGGLPVPRSFFGLSTEYWSLPRYQPHLPILERVISLLRVRGGGPLVLRIGGDSADHTYWNPQHALPSWDFVLTEPWLQSTSSLIKRVGLRVIVDLNLVAQSPTMAADWASAALAAFPRRSVIGFEVGNEPDYYAGQALYRQRVGDQAKVNTPLSFLDYSAADYAANFTQYARALRAVAPTVPVAGPSVANPERHSVWLTELALRDSAWLGLLTAHRYPLSACAHQGPHKPTIARLLSENASAGVAASVAKAVRLADAIGVPFRLTELNSVTCGGRRGISNTFATALWAPDAMFELLAAGVDGVNIHVRADAINAPFMLGQAGLFARPLLYGLAMFTRTLGPGARLVPAQVSEQPRSHLKVWAIRLSHHVLHVLIIDKGGRGATVNLRLPAGGMATVQRLLAPKLTSTGGVTLDGQQVGSDGRWHGERTVETANAIPTANSQTSLYRVTVPRYSEALVSVHTGVTVPLQGARSGGGALGTQLSHQSTGTP
jgi:hypothetical protein